MYLELLHAFDAYAQHVRIVAAFALRLGAVQLFTLPVEQAAPNTGIARGADHSWGQHDEGKVGPQATADKQGQVFNGVLGNYLSKVRALQIQ